jgi:hypothetical protein
MMDSVELIPHIRMTRRSILVLYAPWTGGKQNSRLACVFRLYFAFIRVYLSHTQQVQPADLNKFHSEYGTLLKASMSTLRKRDKKREKLRADELVKKKKRATEEVIISGPKRGAGRKKRKRLIATAAKLAAFKKKMAEKDAAKATVN